MISLPDPAWWSASGPLIPLPGGNRNQVFRCQSDLGPLVLKSTPRSEEAMRWLHPVHRAARQAGFIMPEILGAETSIVRDGWTAERFIEGRSATHGDLVDLMARLKLFHELTAGWHQRPEFASATELISGAKSADVDLQALPEALRAEIVEAWRTLPRQQSVVHGDINLGNLLLTGKGPVLLDWDETRVDATVFDLAAIGATSTSDDVRAAQAWEIACCWRPEPERAKALAKDFMSDG